MTKAIKNNIVLFIFIFVFFFYFTLHKGYRNFDYHFSNYKLFSLIKENPNLSIIITGGNIFGRINPNLYHDFEVIYFFDYNFKSLYFGVDKKYKRQEEMFAEINTRFSNLSLVNFEQIFENNLKEFLRTGNKKKIYFLVESSVNMKLNLLAENKYYKIYIFK